MTEERGEFYGRREGIAGVLAAILLVAGCTTRIDYSGAHLYSGFALVDPEAETITPDSWLVVRDGLIVDVGTAAPPQGDFAETHEMPGLYAMPGLIDAHAHITAGPQRVSVGDGALQIELVSGDDYSQSNAAIALAFGITTVRNPGGATAANARYDAMIATGEWTGPEARHAGAVIQPPPFVGESFVYPTTTEAWDAEAARQAAAGMTYFKLYVGLTEQDLTKGVVAAKAYGLIPSAHLNRVSWTRAVELGVEHLEHALPTSPDLLEPAAREQFMFGADYMTRWFELADYDGPLVREMVRSLVDRGVVVTLTLQVNELIYFADRLETVFPEMSGDLLDYLHPDLVAALTPNYRAMAAVPAEQLARGRAVWPKVMEFARMLHEAGVRLMIGTDGTGGGPTYARELSNHARAGIPKWEVLRMATSGNAASMGVVHRTGRIAPGLDADLVFLRADPSRDVAHVREVEMVMTNGQTYRPGDLLAIARQIADSARQR